MSIINGNTYYTNFSLWKAKLNEIRAEIDTATKIYRVKASQYASNIIQKAQLDEEYSILKDIIAKLEPLYKINNPDKKIYIII